MYNLDMMYPDYIAQLDVLVCPSDSGWGVTPFENPVTGETDLWRECTQGDRGVEIADNSYYYWGHLLDKVEDTPEHSLPAVQVLQRLGRNANGVPPEEQIAGQAAALYIVRFRTNPRSSRPALVDSDIDLSRYANICPSGCGNGPPGTQTVMRLRDGIERFLITDINNPAASARAQSNIFILYDKTATKTQYFNHVPGGTNVLYLDGHASFLKYPAAAPATVGFASVMGRFVNEI